MRPATPQPADILGRTPRLAATLKEGAAAEDDTWRDFALVALDLAGQRQLTNSRARIAAATVEAFEAQKRAAA